MAEKPFAQPIVQAIKCRSPHRLAIPNNNSFAKVAANRIASTAKLLRNPLRSPAKIVKADHRHDFFRLKHRISGIRDRAMLHLAFAASLRVPELVSLRIDQIDRHTVASIHVMGKGRRERVLPLWKETAVALKAWLVVRPASGAAELFLNATGRAMTRSGFEYILTKHVATAARKQPSIADKRVTPHVLRHTCAMHTLQATRDVRKVSLWLGHVSLQRTEIYMRADPTEKLEALAAMAPPSLKPSRFRSPDKLLAMLKSVSRSADYVE